jgi:small-conductance mechanosensitive channel
LNAILDYRLFRIGQTPITVENALTSIAILVVAWLLARAVLWLVVHRFSARGSLALGTRYAIGRILGYVIVFLGVTVALEALGVNLAALAVFGGALGIGLGIGLQDIAKNFVSGLIILLERPVQVGDRIEVGDVTGDVVEIRARATVVRTNDDVHLIVPNSRFISDTVTNRSYGHHRVRYRIPVSVAYGTDPRKVRAALLDAAARSSSVLTEPPPVVWFRQFGESSLDFDLLCWTTSMLSQPSAFRSELNYLVHDALKEHRIEVPFPQRDLHIRSVRGLEGLSAAALPGPGYTKSEQDM